MSDSSNLAVAGCGGCLVLILGVFVAFPLGILFVAWVGSTFGAGGVFILLVAMVFLLIYGYQHGWHEPFKATEAYGDD